MENKKIREDAREAQALSDEELDAVAGGATKLDPRKPQTLSGDELDELLSGTQMIGILGGRTSRS